MSTHPALRRRLQYIVALFVPAFLLLFSTYRGASLSNYGANQVPSVVETLPTFDVSTSTVKGIGLPVGRPDHTGNLSSHLDHLALFKRIREPLGYGRMICEGDKYLKMIKVAFNGQSPAKEFLLKELDNGWTKTTAVDDEDAAGAERRWKLAFEGLFGQTRGYPPRAEIKPVMLRQDKAYVTFLDKDISAPTNAYSYGLYYPSRSLMMSIGSYSAVTRIEFRNQGITKERRNELLPPVSSLSDLMWLAWNTVSSSPKELRYIARDNVVSEDGIDVMDYLLSRDKGETRNVPWPGLEYKGDSDEGKALLATSNGRATAWLLIDHAQEMKWKGEITQRELKVNIFSVFGDFCMLWDLEPQSPRGKSKRGRHIKRQVKRYTEHLSDEDHGYYRRRSDIAFDESPSQPQSHALVKRYNNKSLLLNPHALNDLLVRRAAPEDFHTAVCTGLAMWAKIATAFNGHGDPVQYFNPSALDNGWTRTEDKLALDSYWRNYFDQQLGPGKVPPKDQIWYIRLKQDKGFKDSHGRPVIDYSGMEDAGTALYYAYYVPSISAVVVKNMVSPTNVFKNAATEMGLKVPSNTDIAAHWVPPLNRWSDVTWTVYEDISKNAKSLQYIGHDHVINAVTARVMVYIIYRHRRVANAPFPGLEFGMDTEEGQALLGTPNGMGTAWLLYDHTRELGRRNLKVTIWSEGERLMMAWNMKPV